MSHRNAYRNRVDSFFFRFGSSLGSHFQFHLFPKGIMKVLHHFLQRFAHIVSVFCLFLVLFFVCFLSVFCLFLVLFLLFFLSVFCLFFVCFWSCFLSVFCLFFDLFLVCFWSSPALFLTHIRLQEMTGTLLFLGGEEREGKSPTLSQNKSKLAFFQETTILRLIR